MNHVLGNYIRLAFHDPKHYPRQPFSDRQTNKQVFVSDNGRANMARIKYGKHKDGDN